MEDATKHRFVVDENEVVVDNLAYFVYTSLQTQKFLSDERFTFMLNRVFREYLLPGSDEDARYKPLSITWLLRQSDAKSAHYLQETWSKRYNLDLSCNQQQDGTFSCEVSKTVGDTRYTISTSEESDNETIACLLALSSACLEWSTIQRTEQYNKAKKTTE
jgi:hypothetical protein